MSVGRTIRCDGPECECHVCTDHPAPHLPGGFIETREGGDVDDHVNHFCGWDCLMKFAAKFDPPELVA